MVLERLFPDLPHQAVSNVYLEIPKEKKFGDFSSNIAMRLSREIRRPPFDIAHIFLVEIKNIIKEKGIEEIIKDIKIEKPGFINFYITESASHRMLKEIIEQGKAFGSSSIGKSKKIQIEFVSANPTGPLTVAHGRQAAIGDSLAKIFEFCGYKVTREYYINDEGVQIEILGKSIKARLMELIGKKSEFPENGYKGEYIYDIAKKIKDNTGEQALDSLPSDFFVEQGCAEIMKLIMKDLEDFGVHFDAWYSQKALASSGKIEEALDILRKRGVVYEQDGATWFKSTEFGDDKDRVLIKNDGSYTYVTPDIAYHKEKFEQGYEKIINIWGPDHHGYINRIKSACEALGYHKDSLCILIAQLVTLYRAGKPVMMSTRQGEFVTLREVIDEVGKDAGRFFFIMRRTDSHLDFDLELAKAKTMDNPVYYIQYGHARICSIIDFSNNAKPNIEHIGLLDKDQEIDLIKLIAQFPAVIESSASNLEPYMLSSYLQSVASLFHSYYNEHRIVTDDKLLTSARLSLVYVVKTVLASGLNLLGVEAPQKM